MLSHAMKMQSADAFVCPLTTASASSTPLIALGGENENTAGDRAMASLWIQRLKTREELDSLKGEALVSDNDMLQGVLAGNSDVGCSTHLFGSHLEEASFTKAGGNKPLSETRKLDEKKVVLTDAVNKQTSSSEGQDYGVEGQQNLIKQGQGKVVPLATSHMCAELTSQIADAKSERKSLAKLMTDTNVNSRCTSEPAMTLHTCIQAAERKSQVLHAVRVQAAEGGILTSSLGKPPLPPSHNKAGLPPRSAGQKSSRFLARSAGKISSSSINNKLVATPLQDTARHPSNTAVMKEILPATIDSTGPLLKKGRQFKEEGMDCQDPLSNMCIETRRVLSCTQFCKSASFSQKVVPSVELGMQQLAVCHSEGTYSSLESKPPKKITRQDFEAMDVIASEAEVLKKPNVVETSKRASSTLLKESSMLKTPSECTVVSSQADQTIEATLNASTTARFPWEMFAGAAGPSRSARDEFVEVYNRARTELKNQRSASSITKVFYKEMESRPKFASGHATCLQDTSIVEHGQTSDRQLQREIPEKQSKVEGLDCVSQHEGAKATATSAPRPQKDPVAEKHNHASFLEGDADISPGKKLQPFQSILVTCGKESNSFMHGQSGGPLHGCVESPAAVGQKNCSSTFDKSSQCRQGFACNAMPEEAASIHREPLQTAHVDQSGRVPNNNKRTFMILSKRQLGTFDSSPGIVTGKQSSQRITLSRKSDAWLQRWYSPYITRIKGAQEHKHSEPDRLGQDSVGNMLIAKESDEHGAHVKEAVKKRLIEKGVLYQRIAAGGQAECSKASSEKVLPSAAAMAIVGTCVVEPQQRGTFAFWSGFGVQTPRTREHFTEQGKRKLTFKADLSAQP